MKTVLTLVCILSVAHHVASTCNLLKAFDTTFVPACSSSDVYIKWPNYANQTTYYTCYGVGTPAVTACPTDEVFIYVLQTCGACTDYIPPVPCNKLRTQNPPNCTAIGSVTSSPGAPTGPSYPTPNYPDTTTATTKTTRTTRTTASTTSSTSSAETESTVPDPSPPTANPTTPSQATDFPGPETPATPAPNVPTPPTPAATPPNVDVTPPNSP